VFYNKNSFKMVRHIRIVLANEGIAPFLLGPEFLLVIALGQWSSARTSSKVCIIFPEIYKLLLS
jgi:hypothetical protein